MSMTFILVYNPPIPSYKSCHHHAFLLGLAPHELFKFSPAFFLLAFGKKIDLNLWFWFQYSGKKNTGTSKNLLGFSENIASSAKRAKGHSSFLSDIGNQPHVDNDSHDVFH